MTPSPRHVARGEAGSAALLVLAGGGLAMLLASVVLLTVADLVVTRGQAQLAADAAALAAMGATSDSAAAQLAARLARHNGGELIDCCGGRAHRRQVEVQIPPRSRLLALAVPAVRARAAAGLVPRDPSPHGAVTGGPVRHGAAGRSGAVGDRVWPVAGRVSSGFGYRIHPIRGGRRLHTGLDVAAPTGTPIRAAAAGVVVAAGARGGYGLAVDIDHGAVTTRYAHQSRLLVAAGQRVAAGQVIGLVGSTGLSTGPHLHFEVRTAAGPIDPLGWLPSR